MTQNPAETQTASPAGGKKKRFGKKWLVLLIIVAAAVAAVTVWRSRQARQPQTADTAYTTAEVALRSVTRTLTSSGTLEPADSYTVNTLVSGEILSDTFEEGDLVEKDQLLYTMDASDAATSQTQASNSYSQAQRNYQQAVDGKYPAADMTGTVKEVYVRNGDTVSAGTQLLKIVGDDRITMDFLFSYVDSSQFYVGQSATIFIDGLEGSLQGTVEGVSSGGNADDTGRVNTTVRVTARNPGLVSSGYTASAVIGSYTSYGESGIHVAGDKIEGGSGGALCTIYDLSYLEMTMSIDELDISDVAVGQTVSVTADAVEGKTYTGTVTKVSVAGVTSGGITTYPVTVRIDETDGLLPGMNVDAAIVIAQAENVLTIPSGAVSRGDVVLITADSPSAANAADREAPEGYVYVVVTTGIDDDSTVEITSGLQEGDTVAYITTSSNGQSNMMGGMMMGGMPAGGAPAGGAPAGAGQGRISGGGQRG